MSPWIIVSHSPEQTQALGEALGCLLGPSMVVVLSGDLGSGKTCFTQGLGRGLGVSADEPVVSPSYTLMNQYRGRLNLYHFDLYRLVHPDDLLDLGFDEYFSGDGVTVVEWGDRFPELKLEGIRVHLEQSEGECRKISLNAEGIKYLSIIATLRSQWESAGEHYDRV